MIRYYPDWNDMCETLDMNTHLPKPVKEEKEPEKTEEKEEKKEDEKEKVLSFLTLVKWRVHSLCVALFLFENASRPRTRRRKRRKRMSRSRQRMRKTNPRKPNEPIRRHSRALLYPYIINIRYLAMR